MSTQSSPLLPLCALRCPGIPAVCVPGAGASVTTFMDFVSELSGQRPIYGLQPRGIDPAEPPHRSVEEVVSYNLVALLPLALSRGIHLIGHSYGGLVAFEMARRLSEARLTVASLTLIDTEPPRTRVQHRGELSMATILGDFLRVLEDSYERSLPVSDAAVAAGQVGLFIHELHAALSKAGCWPSRAGATALMGPLAAFAAAHSDCYVPAGPYNGRLRLVLAREPCWSEKTAERASYIEGWRQYAEDLDVWFAPGNHFSLLRAPNAGILARWWS